MSEPGCADVAERLFVEFGARLGLSTVSAVVLHQRKLLLARGPVVSALELERCARQVLQTLLDDPTTAGPGMSCDSPASEPEVTDSAVTR